MADSSTAVVNTDEHQSLPHALLQPAEDDAQLDGSILVPVPAVSNLPSASGRVLVQPATSSLSKKQQAEETKEQPAQQPPAFFRPASIRVHHHTSSSSSSVAPSPLSPLPPPSPASSLNSPSATGSALRNLFGRKKNAVLPLPSSPVHSDATLTSDVTLPLASHAPAPVASSAEAASGQKEKTATTQRRQASAAWSQSESDNWRAAAPADAAPAQLTAVHGLSEETVTEEEEAGEAEATRSVQGEEQKEPPAAARDTRKDSEQRLTVDKNDGDDDEAQLSAQQQQSRPHVQPSDAVAAPTPAAAESGLTTADVGSPSHLFPELAFLELSPLPPELASLTQQLLSLPSPHLLSEAFSFSDSAADVLTVGESGWEELRAAELERETLRLQAAQAGLMEWKAREWRVWKEEERMRRLLAAEEAKLMKETRQREEAAWSQQQQRVQAELRAFDAQQGRLLSSLSATAVVSVAPLETAVAAASPPAAPASSSSSCLPPYPPLHRRYTAVYSHTPRLLSLHIHALRAVKNKLGPGSFSIRVTLLDRLGGRRLQWQGGGAGAYSSQSCTREPQHHGGGWWEQELLFHQPINRITLACPPEADTRPAMLLLFELLPAAALPDASGWAVSASAATTPSAALAWGAFPLASFSSTPHCASSLVHGHHRLPLLLGPVDSGIRSWRQLHRRLSLDLSSWLCNLYFYAERGEDRVEEDRQYCVDLSVVRPIEAKQEAGEEKDGEAAAGDDDSSAASLLSARLRRMDLKHAALVRDVRRLDGAAAEDVNDPFAVWPQKDGEGWRRLELTDEMERAWRSDGPGDHLRRCLSVEMRTRRKKRKAAGGDAAQLQVASSAYLFAVDAAPPTASASSSAPPLSLLRVKLRWLLYHLDSHYQVMQPLSVPCLLLALTFLLSLWSRLFLHYFAQWVYLASVMPTVSIECSALSCSFLYSQQLTAEQTLLLSIIGTVIPLMLLLLLMAAVWLFHRCSQRSAPALLHTVLLCLCACLVLDPFVIDSSSLYHHAASSLSTALAACLSVTSSLLCLLLLYVYLLYAHDDGALMDTVVRLHAPDSLYMPNDYELCMRDVLAVVSDSRQWRGEMGERRRITVREQPAGPVLLSIVTVDAEDEQLEVYRQFALMDGGDVFELFDSKDVTQPQSAAAAAAAADSAAAPASETVAPAAADAYLASLLKGRRKVADRSAAVLWALVRDKFGFTAARLRGDSRGRGSTIGNGSGSLRTMGTFAARTTFVGARLRTNSSTGAGRLGI